MGSKFPRNQKAKDNISLWNNGTNSQALNRRSGRISSETVPLSLYTPITRLKRFQKVRDKNLRKTVLKKSIFKSTVKNMEVVSDGGNLLEKVTLRLTKLDNTDVNGHLDDNVPVNGVDSGKTEQEAVGRRSPRIQKLNSESSVNGKSTSTENDTEKDIDVETLNEDDEDYQDTSTDFLTNDKTDKSSTVNDHESSEDGKGVNEVSDAEEENETEKKPIRINLFSRELELNKFESNSNCAGEGTSEVFQDKGKYESKVSDYLSSQFRIKGRRSIRANLSSPIRKRKAEDNGESMTKRRAIITPSIVSPGWRFFSSTISNFLVSTPFRNAAPEDDSLYVNCSTDSEASLGQDDVSVSDVFTDAQIEPEETEETHRQSSPPTKESWLSCSLM